MNSGMVTASSSTKSALPNSKLSCSAMVPGVYGCIRLYTAVCVCMCVYVSGRRAPSRRRTPKGGGGGEGGAAPPHLRWAPPSTPVSGRCEARAAPAGHRGVLAARRERPLLAASGYGPPCRQSAARRQPGGPRPLRSA